MKKFLLFGLMAFTFALNIVPKQSQAQRFYFDSQYGKRTDTLTNSTAKYLTVSTATPLTTASPNGGYDIQLNVVNLTGTMSSGTFVLHSSIDGVYYYPHFKTTGTNGVFCDTLTTASITGGATTGHIWTIKNETGTSTTLPTNAGTAGLIRQNNSGRRLYFRIYSVGAGTHTSKIDATGIVQN